MRIKRVKIDNYKSIREMKLNLDPKLNIFISKNGSGKTTVVEAITRAVNYAKDLKHRDHKGQRNIESGVISADYVTFGQHNSQVNVNYTIKNSSTYATISNIPENISTNILTLLDDFNYLPFKNYPTERETYPGSYSPPVNVMADINMSAIPILDFFHAATYYNAFYEWLIERENMEYQEVRSFWIKNKHTDVPCKFKDSQLDTVISTICNCTGFKNIFAHGKNGRVEVTKSTVTGDITVPADCLSRGELNYICLIGDIAVQQMLAFEQMDNPLEGEGVYVIDELEKHLHPEWQRSVLARLQRNFPNCQFIITTHSPLIIGSVRNPAQIYILDNEVNGLVHSHPVNSYGLPAATIIEDIMGDQSKEDELKGKFTELYTNIARRNIEKAKEIVVEISRSKPFDDELSQAKKLLAELEQKNR